MSADRVRCVLDASSLLGEGPVWDAEGGALYWVDIKRHLLMRLDPGDGSQQVWNVGGEVGCFALRDDGTILLALPDGLAVLDPANGGMAPFGQLAPGAGTNRFNDGKVDPSGRFWVGSIDDVTYAPTGVLYSVDAAAVARPRVDAVTCSNGIGWTADGATMYFADSMRRVIWRFRCDPRTGDLSGREVFATIESPAVPDGLAVDTEGGVWVALWDGAAIQRFDPAGRIVDRIAMPVLRPTSCAFGGRDLKVLYITSASIGLSDDARRSYPRSGAVFALDVDVAGVPVPRIPNSQTRLQDMS